MNSSKFVLSSTTGSIWVSFTRSPSRLKMRPRNWIWFLSFRLGIYGMRSVAAPCRRGDDSSGERLSADARLSWTFSGSTDLSFYCSSSLKESSSCSCGSSCSSSIRDNCSAGFAFAFYLTRLPGTCKGLECRMVKTCMQNVNLLPTPATEWTVILPPSYSQICLQMDRPMPLPICFCDRLLWVEDLAKGLNTCLISSSDMPMPWSSTEIYRKSWVSLSCNSGTTMISPSV